MLDALKFVKGAVASVQGCLPSLKHFRIENGLVKGYNGCIALCSPIDLDLEISPKAIPFAKAIQTCQTTVSMHVTKAGRIAVKSGSFKAFVDCTEEVYPDIQPEGREIELHGNFLPAIKKIAPFISRNSSQSWAQGILFYKNSAFVTNNIVILEYWLGHSFGEPINVPEAAIKELLRIGEEPVSMQLSENSVSFHFKNGRWLRSGLLALSWPDPFSILDGDCHLTQPPTGLFDAIADITPFVDDLGKVYFTKGRISTSLDEEIGASVNIEGLPEEGCYNNKQLLKLKDIVEKIDFTAYPGPCRFTGGPIRGALVAFKL